MRIKKEAILWIVMALCCGPGWLSAQAPSGDVAGIVRDESGGVLQGATVAAVNRSTAMTRTATSGEDGTYRIPVLPPGEYELTAEAEGFRRLVRIVDVYVGSTTTVNFDLSVGILRQTVEALASVPGLSFEKYGVNGVVSRFEIENLPLNGREFLQLSVLQPGVTAAPGAGFFSRRFDVSVLGSSPEDTRVTMDGSPIHNALNGSTPQSFSQEVVQEFQLSSANFDPATGLTASGAINVVTRSGGNDFHGNAFFFFRDHNLAAYPALERTDRNLLFARTRVSRPKW